MNPTVSPLHHITDYSPFQTRFPFVAKSANTSSEVQLSRDIDRRFLPRGEVSDTYAMCNDMLVSRMSSFTLAAEEANSKFQMNIHQDSSIMTHFYSQKHTKMRIS